MGVSLMKVAEEDQVVAVARSSAASLALLDELALDEPAVDEVTETDGEVATEVVVEGESS
jgi:hypothetical protein